MLYVSLILAAILLAITNRAARRSKEAGGGIFVTCLLFLVGPLFLGLLLMPVVILAALLPVAVIVRTPRYWTFSRLSLVATLIAFVIPTLWAIDKARGYAKLRAVYPFESMEDRVPAPKPSLRVALPQDTLSRLDHMETRSAFDFFRSDRLERLHEDAVGLFVNSYGFGAGRMIPTEPTEESISRWLAKEPVPTQPGPRPEPARSPGEWMPIPPSEEPLWLWGASVEDFVNPRGYGYIKDRRHVAGFESHRFSQVPEDKSLRVRTLDLVGLLLHDEPRVYVSEQLPTMDRLRGAPTRPLDTFERQALKTIEDGDDLVAVRDGPVVRMLGAIRSTRQCVGCHGGERGDLLGAFSYTLGHNESRAAAAPAE